MYRITIERFTFDKYVEQENKITKHTPTEITEESDNSYGPKRKVAYADEYQVVGIEKTREIRRLILNQEIENEDLLSIAKVIQAINNL